MVASGPQAAKRSLVKVLLSDGRRTATDGPTTDDGRTGRMDDGRKTTGGRTDDERTTNNGRTDDGRRADGHTTDADGHTTDEPTTDDGRGRTTDD